MKVDLRITAKSIQDVDFTHNEVVEVVGAQPGTATVVDFPSRERFGEMLSFSDLSDSQISDVEKWLKSRGEGPPRDVVIDLLLAGEKTTFKI